MKQRPQQPTRRNIKPHGGSITGDIFVRFRYGLPIALCALTAGFIPHAAHAVMEDYPSVKLQGLDKSVGRTVTFEAKVGTTIQYGPLYIKIHACRKAPPIEAPESAAFLQIWEVPPGEQKSEWVFSGWMFASSPALSAMDHPVYDVWVLDCTGREEPNEEAKAAESKEQAADQTDLPAADAQNPVQQQDLFSDGPIPTDSEAEPEDAAAETTPQGITPDATAPIPQQQEAPSPDAPYYQYNQAPAPQTQQQAVTPGATAVPDDRATAYDYMRQP